MGDVPDGLQVWQNLCFLLHCILDGWAGAMERSQRGMNFMKHRCSGAFMSNFLYKLRNLPRKVEALAEPGLLANNACIQTFTCRFSF